MKLARRKGHTINRRGWKTGAVGLLNEYDVIREYAVHVDRVLNDIDGLEIIDVTPPIKVYNTARDETFHGIKAANAAACDLFVSLHANYYSKPSANGCGVFYYPGSAEGEKLAAAIQKRIVDLGFKDRGIKAKKYWETTFTDMPAVIVEPFFISNIGDCELYNAQTLGKAIGEGIKDYLELKEIPLEQLQKVKQFQDHYNFLIDNGKHLRSDGVIDAETRAAYTWIKEFIKGGPDFERFFN